MQKLLFSYGSSVALLHSRQPEELSVVISVSTSMRTWPSTFTLEQLAITSSMIILVVVAVSHSTVYLRNENSGALILVAEANDYQ